MIKYPQDNVTAKDFRLELSRSRTFDMREPIVKTKYGRLCGSIVRSMEGYDYYSFKGIPYAKPPLGDLRFRDPRSLEPWSGIRNAIDFGAICAQYDLVTRRPAGSDDCLYLNIYSKSIDPYARKPVMVWIHGGGFLHGCGNDMFFGPDFLLKHDVVLVTINYRVGVLGFLNLEDEVAPGNQGLKDQVMALQWVQSCITNFGGDAENVTIFGESAGGASVHYLGISPLAKGLFHKAISQSGVALNTWASMPRNPKKFASNLCRALGKDFNDPRAIVHFLRKINCLALIEAQEKIRTLGDKIRFVFPFGPGVDSKSTRPFMPIPPAMAAEEGVQVPYLLGKNYEYGTRKRGSVDQGASIYVISNKYLQHQPGIIIERYGKNLKQEGYDRVNNNFENYLHPRIFEIIHRKNLTPEDLRRAYFSYENISEENDQKFADLWGDMHFVEGIHRAVKMQINKSSASTYLYQFTFDQGFSFIKSKMKALVKGACHGEELFHLFNIRLLETLSTNPLRKGTKNYRLMEQMTKMWTDFAKTGILTPTTSNLIPLHWQPVVNDAVLRYMNIGEELRMETMLSMDQRFPFGKLEKEEN